STQLSGALLTPTIPTMATGALRAELQGNQLVVTGTLHNLSGALSTELEGGIIVHVGLAGTDGAVTFPLNGITTNEDAIVFESENNTILLSEVQRNNLISRRNYVQVYTRAYPTGELRGQWLPESTNYAVIQLSGTSVMPAVEDTGTGLLLVEINGEEVVFSGAFTDLSTDFNGSVQLYSGFAGTSGIIALELDAIGGGTQNGRFEPEANAYNLTPVLLEELYSRQMYVSLGAVGRTNGALRGQILPIATQYYTTYLAGANEVPGRTSSGFGNLKLELAGTRLTVTGSFGGLTSDYDPAVGSHLHLGRNGQNGAVLFPLTPMVSFDERSASYFAADNTFELNDEQITALRASEVYVNVHSIAQPTGELRGQVLPERLTFPTAVDSFALSEMMTFTIAGLPNEHFDFDWVASASAQSELLTYRWELAVEPTFDAPITFLETDTATIATLDLFTLDQLLEGLELAVDDELDLYQRVITSNGSLQKPSTVRLVRLRRGRVEPPAAYTAQLSGINEVLPVLTRATGRVSALLTNNTLEISGSFGNLSDTLLTEIAGGAHLHLGYAGQNGAVIRSLSITLDEDQKGGQFLVENNTFELTEQERTALLNRQLYINIHSAAFPNGELRGQLLPPNTEVYVANLSGSEEVPAVISGGRGAVVLDLQDTILTVSGSFDQLDGTFAATTGAHLHLGLAGQNGDVIFPLQITVAEDGKSGIIESQNNIYTIDITQSIALSLRNAYVNVHTDLHPTGELRGQIIEPALAVFRAHLSGTNEVPAVNTQANGQVIAELTTDNTLVISGTYNELSGNLSTDVSGGVHLHLGLAGQNGEVAIPLRNSVVDSRNGIFNSTNNSYPLTDTQVSTLLERGFYINLHSDAYPSGELRGQFLPASQVVFNGVLSGIFESPTAVNTAAHGQIKAELQGNLLTISGAYENLSADLATDLAGGAHIHLGLAGQNGDIEHLLRITETDLFGRSGLFLPSENTFELTDAQVAQIKNRQNYINIHSVAELSGEIRAQLLPEATTYLVAPLGGNSEVPPVQTDATGMAILEINGTTGTLTGTAQQLSGSFDANVAGGAHIHNGWAGRNGDILVGLVTDTLADSRAIEFMAASNQFELTQGEIDSL
ncbi:MAG: CHRD domain-containing protein, partial [Bacteroidota bacterium]